MKNYDKGEKGFSYIETIISIVVVTIGLLGAMSALTWGLIYIKEAEKRTIAKQFITSTLESIFAVRDVTEVGSVKINGWDAVQIKTAATPDGMFIGDWYPVRESAGADAVYGTADDSCAAGNACSGNAEINGFSRKIFIRDIVENGITQRKRLIEVSVKYYVGTIEREEKFSAIIADLKFD